MQTQQCRCGKDSTKKIYIGSDDGELQYCGEKKCSDEIINELHEISSRHYCYQGKKHTQIVESEKFAAISIAVLGITLVVYGIFELINHIIK